MAKKTPSTFNSGSNAASSSQASPARKMGKSNLNKSGAKHGSMTGKAGKMAVKGC